MSDEAKAAMEETPNVLDAEGALTSFDGSEDAIESFDSEIDDWDDLDEAVGADSTADSEESVEENVEAKAEETEEEVNEEGSETEVEEEEEEAGTDAEKADDDVEEASETEEKALSKKEEEAATPELVEVKVDGKVEKVSLDELKENYSGKVAYDKKFTELDKERNAYKSEVDQINNYVTEFGRIAQSGDAVKAMQYLGSFAGVPSYQIKEMMVKQLTEEVYRREGLTEDELNFERAQDKLNHDKEYNESERQRMDKEQASSALQSQILEVRAAQNIGQEEWDKAVSSLDSLLDPSEQITPEIVGKFVSAERLDNKAVDLLSGFSDRIEATDEVIKNLSNYISTNSNLSDTEIKDIIKSELDEAENKVKQESLAKAREIKEEKPKKKAKKAKVQESESVGDWDDLIGEEFL
jgi:hypothetical protein